MYKISNLSNGIRVVTEYIDYVKSVSVGVWIGAGSAMETPENNGVSHYIEHMLFKGTSTRSAKEIAEAMDSIGGQLNAVTSKEYTCYYAKTLSEHSHRAFDVLSDMIVNSAFTEESIETERGVIREEIAMCDDTPEDLIHDTLSRIMWQSNPLGYPIAGTVATLSGIDRAAMLDYKSSLYCGENMVISVVGCFDEKEVLAELEKRFASIPKTCSSIYTQKKIDVVSSIELIKRDIEQCHLCLGLEGVNRSDSRFYDLMVVNAILGGNMSSRLFQKVREEYGLAYSIYSYANTYHKNGSFVIYAGLNADSLCRALELIGGEIKLLKSEKLTTEEISTAKEQLKASVIMGLEGMSARMSSYGKGILFENKIRSMEDTIHMIDSVSQASAAEIIEQIFVPEKLNIAVCGKISESKDNILNAINI